MNLDGFSLHPLAAELNHTLAGGRIDKITQPNRQTVVILVRQPGHSHLLYISINPQNPAAYLISDPPENPAEPPTFCMVLRKHLETGRIASVRQPGLERLLTIEIDVLASGGQIVTKSLQLELMGKYSNIILTADGIILDSLRRVGTNSSRVRTVLPGEAYQPPPPQDKRNLLTGPLQDITAQISASGEKKLSQALIGTCLGFGPVSAKEAAFCAGLAPELPAGQLEASDLASLQSALAELRDAVLASQAAPCMITGSDGKPLAMAAFPLHYLTGPEYRLTGFPSMSALLEAAAKITGSYVPPDKERFGRLITNELAKAKNKLKVLEEEAIEAENAEDCRLKGDNLMTWQYSLTDHAADEVTVADIYSPDGAPLVIALDRRLTINQNCQNYYRKYNKLKRAQILLKQQLAECKAGIMYLESIAESLKSSVTLSEINDIHSELIAGGYLREKPKKKPSDKATLPLEFTSPGGFTVLVGKNNIQNDRLTFKTAAPNDIWLHTKDIPGSHVVMRTSGNTPGEPDIIFAAQKAAAFSKAAASSKVPVDYTLCRHVKKPSGAKPGFVIFTGQKTIYVNPSEGNS